MALTYSHRCCGVLTLRIFAQRDAETLVPSYFLSLYIIVHVNPCKWLQDAVNEVCFVTRYFDLEHANIFATGK